MTRVPLPAAVLVLATALSANASCGWILGFDDSDLDAGITLTDAALWVGDAGPDLYEPNDRAEDAVALEPGQYTFTIAPEGDQDYWQLVVGATADVTIELVIRGPVDLDLELYSINQLDQPLFWSRGVGERESIACTAAATDPLAPGVYLIRVAAFNDLGQTGYDLAIAVTATEE